MTENTTEAEERPRILVVDDEPLFRYAVTRALQLRGYDVESAPDGLQAVEMASSKSYALVLSDLRLPGLDGLGVARSLKEMVHHPKFLLITAYPEWRVYEKAGEIGVDDVISKPVKLKALVERVRELIRAPGWGEDQAT